MMSKNTLFRPANILMAGCVCAGCLFWACTNLQNVAGGIEGGNTVATITGNIADSTSAPLADVRVLLLPSAYNPVTGQAISSLPADTTNSSGNYSIKVAQTGSYTIEAVDNGEGNRTLVTGVSVTGKDTMLVRNAIARPSGVITIALPADVDRGNGYFYVQGTTVYSFVGDDTETVALDSVPAGVSLSIYYAVRGSAVLPQLVRGSVVVAPKDTTNVEYVGWNFSKKLFLNTTVSGANVIGNVRDFPVLVRLAGSNFTFAEAKSDGGDLRFAKGDGTPLLYEIERWDASSQAAEVWVKVDTVFGNDSTHFVNMYWGNPNATSASNGAMVFDTLDGFQGVWHLGEAAGQAARDATANHFDATPSDTAPSVVSGTIGLAQEFNGISNYLQMRGTATGKLNFSESDTFTVSAWVYSDTLVDSTSHLIVGKGHQQYYLKQFFAPQGQEWEFTEFLGGSVWQITSYTPAVAKSWKFLFGLREGNTQFLYLDGVLVNSNVSTGYANATRDTSNDVTIGRYLEYVTESNQGFAFFNGIIDEVRISNVSRSADWIKLCYMNQKEPDVLLKW
jgi:Concanavalin A-like lectin/glucanases superfamily/Domain of unknown function (DUF2341)